MRLHFEFMKLSEEWGPQTPDPNLPRSHEHACLGEHCLERQFSAEFTLIRVSEALCWIFMAWSA